MNALQYKIVKSVIAVGADPMDFIKVQTTDNFNQYKEDDSTSMEDIIKGASDSIFGKGKK